ncbi:F-box only protein 34 isoform 1-T5 [Odontesthes bonariensis]|uniref:F-box only protein 34 n=1 Tax=Odontesthes bonariensis TaxID=219752 RepID=UPI003F58B3CD
MHLKSYPKVTCSELHLDTAGIQISPQWSGQFVNQQGRLPRTFSSNHGNFSNGRLPFSIISTNTLRRTSTTNSINSNNGVTALQLKVPPNPTPHLLPSQPGSENDSPGLYRTRAEDTDAALSIWTVITPGHVREKIAIFASEGRCKDGAGSCEHTSASSLCSHDRTLMACTNTNAMTGVSRAVKAKGSWEEKSTAKRRRRSANSQKLQQDQRTQVMDEQTAPPQSDPALRPGRGLCRGELGQLGAGEGDEDKHKVSVVEMVAFLEQRASEQQPDLKPLLTLQRSSTTITLCKMTPPEIKGEEPENIRVSEMVAKLESECLRRRTEGGLSRSNSLRRTVGRVLLAAGDQIFTPCQPPSPPSSAPSAPSPPSAAAPSEPLSQKPISFSQKLRVGVPALTLATPPSPGVMAPFSGGLVVDGVRDVHAGSVSEKQMVAPPLQCEREEPLPGLLFLPCAETALAPPHYRTSFYLQPEWAHSPPALVSPAPCGSDGQLEKKGSAAGRAPEEEVVGVPPCFAAVPLGRSASVSQDFLELRQRLQQLLAPQPYLLVLPHHLLVKLLLLLPTRSLAALKCTCSYFNFIIQNYGVRPADSLWVSDPRYRDDPCKQCKKRYGPGDVSLCRWHHKPYCQALPYGPGYWMCCHGARRDAPGCNVGLHDNRWVPSFHSINVPIYRGSCNHDN